MEYFIDSMAILGGGYVLMKLAQFVKHAWWSDKDGEAYSKYLHRMAGPPLKKKEPVVEKNDSKP